MPGYYDLIASRRPPGQDCMRQAMKDNMDDRMKGRIDERLSEEDMNRWRGQWMKGWREEWMNRCREEGRNEGSRDEGRNVWKEEGENRYMDVGRKGRTKVWKEGGIDPTSERKGAEKSNIDPRIYKKGGQNRPTWCQNRPKRVPKRSQDRQKIRAASSRRSWIRLGGDFPTFVPSYGSLLESKIEPNS